MVIECVAVARQTCLMTIGRAARRKEREPHIVEQFGEDAAAALDLLELIELAWHDCYGEVQPPADVEADILVVSAGSLDRLIHAGRLAVTDWRDLRMNADKVRSRS